MLPSPKSLKDLIDKYGGNPIDMEKAGIDYAVGQIRDLLKHGVDGIHLYTMNKTAQTQAILRQVRQG